MSDNKDTTKDGGKPQAAEIKSGPGVSPPVRTDETKFKDFELTDEDKEKLKEGWEPAPVYRYNRHTKKREVSGHVMRKAYVEEYWKVEFNVKANEMETDVVKLGKNNTVLRLKRGEEIIVPRSYLRVADDGKTVIFKQDQDGSIRKAYERQEARYRVISTGHTKAEYDDFLKKAAKQVKKEAE